MSEYKQQLIEAGVVKKVHFLLPDGRHSDTWADPETFGAQIVSDPELFRMMEYLLETTPTAIDYTDCDIIACTPDTIAIAAPIALRTGKRFVYPEKVPYKHTYHQYEDGEVEEYTNIRYNMQLRRGYDKVVKGKKVLLIEDIIATGKSVMETKECIEKAGGNIAEIRCIWNRSSGILFRAGELDEHGKHHIVSREIPILSIINDPVESWAAEECPLCKRLACPCCNGSGDPGPTETTHCETCGGTGEIPNIPLTDPKTGEAV